MSHFVCHLAHEVVDHCQSMFHQASNTMTSLKNLRLVRRVFGVNYLAWRLFLFSALSSNATETYRLQVTPFDFQSEDAGFIDYYLERYHQMVIQGDMLYLRAQDHPQIIGIHTKTSQGTRIGSMGEGPGEFRTGASMMAVVENQIWAVDFGKTDRITHYVNGRYKGAIPIDSMAPFIPSDGLSLAVSDREVIAPVSPRTGHLAMAYGFDGSKTSIGSIPFDKKDGDLVFRIPYVNQTIWHFGGDGFWYAAFPYAPMIYKFNRKFEKVGHFSIEHPVLSKHMNRIMEFEPKRPGDRCITLVSDVKWFRNRLYVMSSGYLMQLNPNSGDLLSITRFSIKDPSDSGPGLKVFPLFAFRDDGTIFLGHPVCFELSGHDMYQLQNPTFLQK